jgi:pyrimidine-nucleoside phosphorylase
MRATDIIRAKRDGMALSREAVEFFVSGVTDGSLPDYQASALLMAIVLRGMTPEETAWLTGAMVQSGIRVDLSSIPGVKVDKHSTGGVGDKTSLVLAPLAAVCGVKVPMMSGRGLGHTGGTLDKLQSIAGFRVDLSLDELKAALEKTGVAMLGQTAQIAPADKKLYALRDVTGTVESIPLITASIMSKKIAEGIDALVLDVKTGRGAFMKTVEDSRRLARSLVDTGNRSGVRTEAVITAMDAPLGRAVGNALEVVECVETLKGRGPADLESLSVWLAARMVLAAGLAATPAEAEAKVRRALTSGAGVEKWREIVAQQGGDPRTVDDYRLMPSVETRHVVTARRSGYLSVLDAELVGRATVALGAGRNQVDDVVDPAVGATILAHPGDAVRVRDPVVELHYRRESDLVTALELVERAIEIADEPPVPLPLIVEQVR